MTAGFSQVLKVLKEPQAVTDRRYSLVRRTRLRGLGQFRHVAGAIAMERRDDLDIEFQPLNVVIERLRIRYGRSNERTTRLRRRREGIRFGQELFLGQIDDQHVAG